MSNKSSPGRRNARHYRKKERAEKEAETRRAITEAVMHLHEEVGPAHTTVTDVAQRAGVSRMTVYNHFPTEGELIVACSAHWETLHPLPDPAPWRDIADLSERRVRALRQLYAWYRETEPMMGKVFRDAPLVPALADIMQQRWGPLEDEMVDVLAAGTRKTKSFVAALRLALDFGTWRKLTASGLSDRAAADLAARLIEATAGPG